MKSYLLKMSQSLYITEIYRLRQQNCTKLKIDFFSEILACETESHYNRRRCNDFRIPLIRTAYCGSESISFLGRKYRMFFPMKLHKILL